jgi:hypothetical protein
MADEPVDDRRLWSSLGKALGAELREDTSITGASGLVHPLQALCVDDKGDRVVLFSDEPNPRVAALIQGDVQATFDKAKVIVARPTVVDLGALVRGLYNSASAANLSLPQISKHADRFNKLSQKKKDRLLKQPNLAVIGSMANAFKNVPMPILSYIGALIQQATHIDWIQVFEALKEGGNSQISLTQLYEYDGSAIDRQYGVCPIPLYQLTETDWELILSGVRNEDIQQRLKELNIFQYFFPAPDQLALGVAERGVTDRKERRCD